MEARPSPRNSENTPRPKVPRELIILGQAPRTETASADLVRNDFEPMMSSRRVSVSRSS